MDQVRVTTELLWRATALFSLITGGLLPLLARWVPRERFATLRTHLAGATFAVWFAIWSVMVIVFWDGVYAFFFPAWSRWLLPLVMAPGFAATSMVLWRLARRARRRSVLVFVLLGACLGPLTHAWAVFRGLVSKPPLLHGASRLAAIAVSLPEFALYFAAIVGLASLCATLGEHRRGREEDRSERADGPPGM
jgi:hypothetical protein